MRLNKLFINAVTFDSFFAEAYYNLGLVYEKLGRYSDSNEQFDVAISLKRQLRGGVSGERKLFAFLKICIRALESYEKAALLLPKSPIVSNNIGMVFLQLEDELQAERYFRESLRCDVKYVPAYNNLITLKQHGSCFRGHVQHRQALNIFLMISDCCPFYAKSLLAQCKKSLKP